MDYRDGIYFYSSLICKPSKIFSELQKQLNVIDTMEKVLQLVLKLILFYGRLVQVFSKFGDKLNAFNYVLQLTTELNFVISNLFDHGRELKKMNYKQIQKPWKQVHDETFKLFIAFTKLLSNIKSEQEGDVQFLTFVCKNIIELCRQQRDNLVMVNQAWKTLIAICTNEYHIPKITEYIQTQSISRQTQTHAMKITHEIFDVLVSNIRENLDGCINVIQKFITNTDTDLDEKKLIRFSKIVRFFMEKLREICKSYGKRIIQLLLTREQDQY